MQTWASAFPLVTPHPPGADEVSGLVELDDAVVAGVGDVYRAGGLVDGDILRFGQLTVPAAGGSDVGFQVVFAVRREEGGDGVVLAIDIAR